MQHFSGHKAHGKQSWKIGSLEDLPPDVHRQLLALSKLAWEGIMKQQLTFSSADIGGVTLGLMESVKELYRLLPLHPSDSSRVSSCLPHHTVASPHTTAANQRTCRSRSPERGDEILFWSL